MASAPRRYIRLPRGYLDTLPAAVSKGSSTREIFACLHQSPSMKRIPGVIRAGIAALAEELHVPASRLRRALAELAQHGLVAYDEDARTLRVRGAIETDPPANPKVLAAWATDLLELPPSEVRAEVQAVVSAMLQDSQHVALWESLTAAAAVTVRQTVSETVPQTVSHTPVPLPVPLPVPSPVPPPPPPPSSEGPSAADLARYLDAAERLGEPFGLAAAAARLSPENLSRLTAIPFEEWGDVLHGLATSFFAGERAKCPPTLLDLIRKPALRAALREGQYEEAGRTLRCACCGTTHPFIDECPPLCRGCNQPHDPSQYCRKLAFLEQCEQQQPASTEPAR
jgi:hypothetical protein